MSGHDTIVIGASAGGIEALRELLRLLPADIAAALFVVQHMPADTPGLLARILDRAGPLRATFAANGEPIERGRVYVAPPDRHLLLEAERLRVVRGPRENLHRPAVDPLFRSAALAFGPRVIGVILSGALDDGTAGLRAIKEHGGVAVVQDPDEAIAPGMPSSALERLKVDHRVRLAEMAPLLVRLALEPPGPTPSTVDIALAAEVEADRFDGDFDSEILKRSPLSVFTCPDCGGALWEIRDGEVGRFRCHIGHAFSPETLSGRKDDDIDHALLIALRTLEEQGVLYRRMADRARDMSHLQLAERYARRADQREREADSVRSMLRSAPEP